MESELTINKICTKEWKLPNGERHREDGPAIEYLDGAKFWYINGQLHREDGPAIEYNNGYKFWYVNGNRYTEQEYKFKMRSIKLAKLL